MERRTASNTLSVLNGANAEDHQVNYMTFNQDHTCFACATNTGFSIYSSKPFKKTISRDFSGGIKIVEMLFRCNMIGLVGTGVNPKHPTNKLLIWDDRQRRFIGEIEAKNEIRAVKLSYEKVFVVVDRKIYIYSFDDFALLEVFDTYQNPNGLCAINNLRKKVVVAFPERRAGTVRVVHFESTNRLVEVRAHESAVNCLTLNSDGNYLATASERGTLIRIWNAGSGALVQEVRRGIDKAFIHSLSFDLKSEWIVCGSDRGTIHIFKVCESEGEIKETSSALSPSTSSSSLIKNKRSKLGFMQRLLPKYFRSEWSYARFRVHENDAIGAFTAAPNKLAVVTKNSNYYLVSFDLLKGGDCIIEDDRNVLEADEASSNAS